MARRSSGSQYARLSPTQPTTSSEASTTAATNVHEAGLPGPVDGVADDRLVGRVGGCLECLGGRGNARGRGSDAAGEERARTSRAARAAARLATSESVEFETPSHTTRTAWLPGSARASSATASSLREWRTPRSHTAATHAAGCSVKWSRGLRALAPHSVQ